ncbi:MAG: signal peptide peptidase SppA [Candidatus Eisenbacteria bacterium]|nr:signal peptide peptidase SppA [Candidatus Eisenbacteria bacterium]
MGNRRPLIALLVFFGVLIAAAVLFVAMLVGKTPEVKEGSFLVVSLGGTLPEEATSLFDMPLLEKQQITLKDVLECLDKAKIDKRIRGVVVKISPFYFGWSKTEEIRDKLVWFKEKTHKPVVCYLISGGDKEYYLASACDKVYMPEASDLFVDGLVSEVTFLRGTLDKLGITPDMEHIGIYKSASDMLTQKTFTEAHREVANAMLDDYFNRLVDAIAKARGFKPEEVRKLIDEGSFTAPEALRAGLVDSLIYEDELHTLLGVKKEAEFTTVSLEDYVRVRPASLKIARGPKIAVIYAVGTITEGKSSYSPLWGKTLGSDTMVEALRDARKNKDIKAIVLRIDSPGGSGLASDIVWREVKLAEREKPFVASMSDVAASGGYYIAMAADTIVAEPGTVTGSIGLVSGKFGTKGLYDKLGMNREIVTRGANAAMFSDTRSFTPAERRKLLEQMWEWYIAFVRKVAEGRGMTEKEVDGVARGRVWTGAQAVDVGLVDVIGGLDRAVEIAKVQAGIPKDSPVTLAIYPKRRVSVLQRIFRRFSSEALLRTAVEGTLGGVVGGTLDGAVAGATTGLPSDLRSVLEPLLAQRLIRPGKPYYLMPYRVEIK